MQRVSQIKAAIARLSRQDQNALAQWLNSQPGIQGSTNPAPTAPSTIPPRPSNRKSLPDFSLKRIPKGWKGRFPGESRLFGKTVLLIAETEAEPDFSKLPQPVSPFQAALVQQIAGALPQIVRKAKWEVESIGIEPAEDGSPPPLNIYAWLPSTNDDGKSWELVVERADGSNFAYHLAYQGTKFVETWAGD